MDARPELLVERKIPSLVAIAGPPIKLLASLVKATVEPSKEMAGASVGLPGVASLPMAVLLTLVLMAWTFPVLVSQENKSETLLVSGTAVRDERSAEVHKRTKRPSGLTDWPADGGSGTAMTSI